MVGQKARPHRGHAQIILVFWKTSEKPEGYSAFKMRVCSNPWSVSTERMKTPDGTSVGNDTITSFAFCVKEMAWLILRPSIEWRVSDWHFCGDENLKRNSLLQGCGNTCTLETVGDSIEVKLKLQFCW